MLMRSAQIDGRRADGMRTVDDAMNVLFSYADRLAGPLLRITLGLFCCGSDASISSNPSQT